MVTRVHTNHILIITPLINMSLKWRIQQICTQYFCICLFCLCVLSERNYDISLFRGLQIMQRKGVYYYGLITACSSHYSRYTVCIIHCTVLQVYNGQETDRDQQVLAEDYGISGERALRRSTTHPSPYPISSSILHFQLMQMILQQEYSGLIRI